MNRSVQRWIIVLAGVFVFSFYTLAAGLKPGDPIPMGNVKMMNVDGKFLTIADIKGEKGTLIIFGCNSCPWVKAWLDRIVAIGNEYMEKGIGVMMINSNDPAVKEEDRFEVMQRVVKAKGIRFPYVVDATSYVARAFGATHTPEVFLFNGEGKLVYHGAIDDNARHPEAVEHHYLKDALEALLQGKLIPIAETKAIGCTIKFRSSD